MIHKRTSILERLKVCWYVLTKRYYLYFGLDKDLIVWNEDGTYKCLKDSSLKSYEYISEEYEFMAYGRKTNLRTFALRVIAKFINTNLIKKL